MERIPEPELVLDAEQARAYAPVASEALRAGGDGR